MNKTLLASLLVAGAIALHAADKPHIVIILADDLGYGDLGCYGNMLAKTPHLDQLAAEGVRFTDFYAPSAVCSPSRAGILTGRNPHRAGIYNHLRKGSPGMLRAGEITIAEWLREHAGYQTALIGKWHLSDIENPAEPAPWEQGFDTAHVFGHGKPTAPKGFATQMYHNNRSPEPAKGSTAQLVGDWFAKWADTVDKKRPFFAWLAPQEPHVPLNLRAKFLAMHEGAGEQQNYQADVTELDALIGRVRTVLKVRGLDKKTLILFTSDNGALMRKPTGYTGTNGALRGQKGQLYEGGIREPAIAWWPGVLEAGNTCAEPLSGLDLFPTFCALAGIEPPARPLDGENIWPCLTQKAKRQRPLFWIRDWAEDGPGVAFRDGSHKVTAQIKGGLLSDVVFTDLGRNPAEAAEPRGAISPAEQTRLLTALQTTFDSVRQDTVTWPEPGHAATPAWLAPSVPKKKPGP